jgi:hypothetical protein
MRTFAQKFRSSPGVAAFGALICLILAIWSCSLHADSYRTPSGMRMVSYEPVAWHIGTASQFMVDVADSQGYDTVRYIQTVYPGVQRPTVILSILLSEIQTGNIGVLRIETHGLNVPGGEILVEVYGWPAEALRNQWYQWYLNNTPLTTDHIVFRDYPLDHMHTINLTWEGVRFISNNMYPDSLEGAIVYQSACHSARLIDDWNALSVLGYDNTICGVAGENIFWQRMNGSRDRVYSYLWGLITARTNKRRSVKHASSGITTYCLGYTAHLEYGGNGNVVLSPIVLDHRPWHERMIGDDGWVEFDCEMNTSIAANQIVRLTGVGLYGPQLSNVRWAFNNNRKIEFDIPDLTGFGWADFQVHPYNAQSLHNHSHLDGDKNPPGAPPGATPPRNGEGPNEAPGGDFYCWTGRVVNLPLITFEGHHDHGDPIGGHIMGLHFLDYQQPPYRFIWRYGETIENSHVYPYFVPSQPPNPDYPVYWVDGRFAAWIGQVIPSPPWIYARVGISDPASEMYLGYSTFGPTIFMLYDSEDPMYPHYIGRFAAGGNPVQEGNLLRHSLGQFRLYPNYNPDQSIDILEIYGVENTFGIDNLMINNHLYGTILLLPPGFGITNGYPGSGYNNESKSYAIQVDETVDSLQVILNWTEADTREMQLGLINPNGETVFDQRSGGPPIMLDPIMADPMPGEWHAKVSVFSS